MYIFIPNLILTRLMGWLASSRNKIIKNLLIKLFIKLYKPNLEESLISDINDFPTYNSFFTRKLKNGVRPIEDSKLTIVSPVDGTIMDHGMVESNMLIQAKNHEYPMKELLGKESQNANESKQYFITI